MKVGLFGGSFDPVHLGHLLVAQAAREEHALDRIFFIPAAQSPFKPGQELAPARIRTRMLHLALAGQPSFEVDEQELQRGGVSYTIDTVRNYRKRFPGADLFYLIGADHVPNLPKWREAAELAEATQFLIIPRPGDPLCEAPKPFRATQLRGFPLGVSASQIRARVKAGLPIDYLVKPEVAEVIRIERLYA